MPIDEAFWIVLPGPLSSLTVRELFEHVFPDDDSIQTSARDRLDLETNPDLANIYDVVVDIFARKRAGLCTVETYQNFGPKLADSMAIQGLTWKEDEEFLLDLVLEQRFSAIDYAVQRDEFADAEEALRWLQSSTLLYFLDVHDYILPIEPINELDAGLLPIAKLLQESGDIQPSEESNLFEITEQGNETVQQMIARAENVLERYEIFADVLYDPQTGECECGTGRGEDIRIPVYEAEGVDPARSVFLVELFDSTLARLEDDWREVIHDREFFETLLTPVIDRPLVADDVLEQIVDAGFALMDAQAQAASQEARNRQLRRALERD
jgi:hypothetical protein